MAPSRVCHNEAANRRVRGLFSHHERTRTRARNACELNASPAMGTGLLAHEHVGDGSFVLSGLLQRPIPGARHHLDAFRRSRLPGRAVPPFKGVALQRPQRHLVAVCHGHGGGHPDVHPSGARRHRPRSRHRPGSFRLLRDSAASHLVRGILPSWGAHHHCAGRMFVFALRHRRFRHSLVAC